MTRKIATALTILAIAILASLAGSPAMATEPVPTPIVGIDVDTADDATIDMLLDAGFYGDPNDGVERLWAPVVVDVENADEWIVDVLLDNGYQGDATDGAEQLYQPLS